MPVPSNWYETFFHGITLDLWRKAIPPEQTTAEAEFLLDHLNCDAGARVLDVPCGNGRLSFEVAKRGLRITGVDISKEFIEEARSIQSRRPDAPNTAAGCDFTAKIEFLLRDMRHIEDQAVYDGAYCFGNSFAFLEHAETEKFLRAVAGALKRGARFIIETGMAAESVLPDFEEQSSHEMGDLALTIKERYLAAESCIDSEYIFERGGQTESRLAREWIYTVAEMRRMLEGAGFSVLDLYGSLKCEAYELGSRELFIVSEARR
ncbi:MAG: cyclopropane-fatty-acyl-phospholipid synthase family protein [Pyrinomonadaceae bacterium]